MKLSDLTKRVSNMSDEELIAHVRSIRHERTVVRPAAAKRKEEVVKVEGRRKGKKAKTGLEKVFANLSDAEREALIKQLEGEQ